MHNIETTLEAKFRALWEATNLTMDDFAALLGEKSQRVKDILRGKTKMPGDVLQKVQARIPVRMEWMFGHGGPIFIEGADHPYLDAPKLKEELAGQKQVSGERRVAMDRERYVVDKDEFTFVNHYADRPSAGGGNEIEDTAPVSVIAFRRDYLAKRRQSNPASLAAFEIRGDSMEPTLFSGDLIVFDTAEKTVTVEDIYLFRLGGNLYVKRLRLMPDGDILMISDNQRYTPVPIEEETALARNFDVIGRFFWRGGDRL